MPPTACLYSCWSHRGRQARLCDSSLHQWALVVSDDKALTDLVCHWALPLFHVVD